MFKIMHLMTFLGLSVQPGRYAMVSRSGADRYAVIGEGEVRTVGCTITADSLEAVISDDGKWITFYDRDGEAEGDPCQIDDGPILTRAKQHRPLIRRSIATVDGR